MPLKLVLKPHERLIINGAAIRNGDRPTSILMETNCRFLRESEMLKEGEADTPAKRLQFILQVLYLSEDRTGLEDQMIAQAGQILAAVPSAGPLIVQIHDQVASGLYHRAIKTSRELVAYEQELLARAAEADGR